MLEMASLGAKVLQIRSVRFAMRYAVPIHVRSSFNDSTGTWVVPEEQVMEELVVSGRDLQPQRGEDPRARRARRAGQSRRGCSRRSRRTAWWST
jgi:aspartokinase